MTAVAEPGSMNRQPGNRAAVVPWHQLLRVTARQHRTAFLWMGLGFAILAIALLATGIPLHDYLSLHRHSPYALRYGYGIYVPVALQAFVLALQLVPVLAGFFLGAPLVAREVENGTTRLAWTQAASRTRWLLAQVLPVACVLAVAALGLGAEFRWWLRPLTASGWGGYEFWSPLLFNVNPLPLAGWVVLAFVLGVFVGAAIRRTLPSMAATLACYGALLWEVSQSWRMHYLAPIHRAVPVHFAGGGGFDYIGGVPWPDQAAFFGYSLGWPDGRLLSYEFAQHHTAAWLTQHHIMLWVTYQPPSRYFLFQLIELGWLIPASVILLAAATVLIRRRPA